MKRIIYLVFVASLAFSCKPEFDEFEGNAGSADFSSYVAVGNSLTAGFADNALYREGQMASFPSMLAEQMAKVSEMGEFKQPLMPEGVGFGAAGNARFVLAMRSNCLGESSLGPGPIAAQGDIDAMGPSGFVGTNGPFGNLGVPGAKSFHLTLKNYGDPAGVLQGTANPFFARMSAMPGQLSIIEEAAAQQASFFTYWVGNNDVLAYATSGGSGTEGTGPNDYTDMGTFTFTTRSLLDTLMANGAKGAVANIPDITTIPFFTTVPINSLTLDEANAAALNTEYAQYNAGAKGAGLPEMVFTPGSNNLVIQDTLLKALGGLRQIREGELLLLSLPLDSVRCAGWGSQKPIPAQFVLDATQIETIKQRTMEMNTLLETEAKTRGLAYVDVNTRLKELQSGISFDGIDFTATFVTGGAFSLDGVHLTPQGYALVANYFIQAINATYGSGLPSVSVGQYDGVQFP